MSALRSTIGVLTIRPIKEIIQWHFGVAACCLSKSGWGGRRLYIFGEIFPVMRFVLHSPGSPFEFCAPLLRLELQSRDKTNDSILNFGKKQT